MEKLKKSTVHVPLRGFVPQEAACHRMPRLVHSMVAARLDSVAFFVDAVRDVIRAIACMIFQWPLPTAVLKPWKAQRDLAKADC
mmetsp:Transcript_21313/g.30983  ORF Transcript_21313/g.30983 Transcript_21313/m.30983 type:complete len:84 (-) Transcript_21313:204-455(-)